MKRAKFWERAFLAGGGALRGLPRPPADHRAQPAEPAVRSAASRGSPGRHPRRPRARQARASPRPVLPAAASRRGGRRRIGKRQPGPQPHVRPRAPPGRAGRRRQGPPEAPGAPVPRRPCPCCRAAAATATRRRSGWRPRSATAALAGLSYARRAPGGACRPCFVARVPPGRRRALHDGAPAAQVRQQRKEAARCRAGTVLVFWPPTRGTHWPTGGGSVAALRAAEEEEGGDGGE